MKGSMRIKILSAIVAGTMVLLSVIPPTTVMARGWDDDDYWYYIDDGNWDDYVSDYMFYKMMKHAYEEEHRYVDVTGVCVSSTAVQLPVGGSYQITGYVKPDNANNHGVCYYSTNPQIATVDGNGVITALNPGTCVIVTKTSEGGYEAYTNMTVTPAVPIIQ